MRWLILPLMALGLMACQDNGPTSMDWRYTVGSNADGIWHTKANFYREGKPVHGSANGASSRADEKSLKERDYRWLVSGGRSGYNEPVPDKVVIEWVSYHDKKRYGITLDLPKDMAAQMARRYRVQVGDKWREEQRNNIALGLASGGYVEVFLRNPKVTPDILLARGLATEVTDDRVLGQVWSGLPTIPHPHGYGLGAHHGRLPCSTAQDGYRSGQLIWIVV